MQVDKLNFSVVTVLGGAAIAIAFFVRGELQTHSMSEISHPLMTAQLESIKGAQNDILADLKKAEIMRVDALICEDMQNQFYRDHIAELVAEWELLTGRRFPREILRCA